MKGADNRITVGDHGTTWVELCADSTHWPGTGPIAVLADGHLDAVNTVAQHLAYGREILIASASRVDAEERAVLTAAGYALRIAGATTEPDGPAAADLGRVWILTSGTTGRPKRVQHTLRSLATVAGEQPERTWLCPYSPGTYAWWQLISLSLNVPGQHLVTVEPDALDEWPERAERHGVTAVSGTPTFWRQSLFRSGDVLGRLPLQQITLGGEPVDQSILDRLRLAYPSARISWIYASSEVGSAIAVHDGRAGFPREWLDRAAPDRPRLWVDQDELVIASPHAAAGHGGPVRTGDRVEIDGDRVLITGRLDGDEINVGGTKVSAGMVRNVLLGHDQIQWVRVTGRRAPLVGRIVTADIVADRGLTEADVLAWAGPRLSEYAMPRQIRLLAGIPMKETLKSDA
ncbi:MAG TPA: AMP-binding protein [Micromonosporaceae bacterium]|jgi:acyl-CoA synthetase (AMP-forming)/AMP-acid ligase II